MTTNFIKIAAKYLLICTFILQSSSMWAQEEEFTPLSCAFDLHAMKNFSLQTTHMVEYGQMKLWDGEGLYVGVEPFALTLFNCKDIPQNIEIPDNHIK